MNDGQDPYGQDPGQDPYAPQVYGYDAYGRPVYQQPQGPAPEYGYDAYGRPVQQPAPSLPHQYDPSATYDWADPHAQAQAPQGYRAQQAPQAPQAQHSAQAYQAQQAQQVRQEYAPGFTPDPTPDFSPDFGSYDTGHPQSGGGDTGQQPLVPPQRGHEPGPRTRPAAGERPDDGNGPYRTEQFSFLEEPDEDSEDVIDWLKFAETRTERRDERRRKTRNRVIALMVLLVLAAAGGVGYLWSAGKLPGQPGSTDEQAGSSGPQQRHVIVLHLHETGGEETSTVLLVDNETTKKGTTVLLPNALAVATDEGGSTTLGKSVEDSSDATREALGALLGTRIEGTWRLDTPYLENLVELVDGITVDPDVTVPAEKKGADPLVVRGKDRTLNGRAAVAYATYRAPAEAQTKQLSRFGQVMHAVLRKMSSDAGDATTTVESLAQIADPSLSEQELGASLAKLAELAKTGAYETTPLPVQQDGTLSQEATDHVVKDILGGTVKNTDQGSTARVSVRNATGKPGAASAAQVALVNGGFTVVGATDAGDSTVPVTRVTYTDERQAAQAREVAKTLGLPAGAVRKGKGAANADVTVELGQDYKGAKGAGAGTGSPGGTDPAGSTAAGATASAGAAGSAD